MSPRNSTVFAFNKATASPTRKSTRLVVRVGNLVPRRENPTQEVQRAGAAKSDEFWRAALRARLPKRRDCVRTSELLAGEPVDESTNPDLSTSFHPAPHSVNVPPRRPIALSVSNSSKNDAPTPQQRLRDAECARVNAVALHPATGDLLSQLRNHFRRFGGPRGRLTWPERDRRLKPRSVCNEHFAPLNLQNLPAQVAQPRNIADHRSDGKIFVQRPNFLLGHV
jgi:hypothetical protein